MPLFSTRSSKREEDNATARNVPIDSIETLRTRARQRLIGSVVLVALGIIGFSLLFDSQPRPIPVDIPIVIPDKDKSEAITTTTATAPAPVVPAPQETVAAPTVTASTPSAATPPAAAVSATASAATVKATEASAAVQASASLGLKEEIISSKTNSKSETPVKNSPETKSEANKTEAKAMAILEGKEGSKTVAPNAPAAAPVATPAAAANAAPNSTGERFIVQFGAYAENDKAREARLKVEQTGLKTYVHVAETPQGKRIRLRVGPFATKVEAEKAAEKIKALNLPAAILTL